MYKQFDRLNVNSLKKAAIAVAAAALFAGATGISVSNAQQAGNGGAPNAPTNNNSNFVNPALAVVCSTTNYTDVAAKALGVTSPELRLALASGKTLSSIASGKSVDLTTVQTALKTAYEADLAQAVTDGLLTQAQADQIKSRLDSTPANNAPAAAPTAGATQSGPSANNNNAPSNNPPGNGGPGNAGPGNGGPGNGGPGGFGNGPGNGDRGGFGGGPGNFGNGGSGNGPRGPMDGFGFFQVSDHNQVSALQVAAKAIGVSCPDLVKALEGGQTIAQVATGKNVTAQSVIDAITAAEKSALGQDVSENLITQAQADRQLASITDRITQLVNNAGMRGPQPPNGMSPNGNGPQPGGNGNGQNPSGNNPPPATAPAAGASS